MSGCLLSKSTVYSFVLGSLFPARIVSCVLLSVTSTPVASNATLQPLSHRTPTEISACRILGNRWIVDAFGGRFNFIFPTWVDAILPPSGIITVVGWVASVVSVHGVVSGPK